MQTGGAIYYYVTNLQGDVVALLDASGSTVASYAYDPYGKVLSAEGTMAETNPLRYRGYYYDAETGLYYLQSRYYDPATCRFVNADNANLVAANGDFASLNLFAYCGNNPLSREDSNGGFWVTIGIMAVAIHADIDDAEQTVYIPEIKTEALSEKDMHIVKATEDITISDTVSYKGLIPGLEYTVTGALMDQSTGEAILDDLGNRITSRTVFTPDASDGAVTVTFKFPGVTLAGKTVVAFENLFYDEQQIAVHADIHDASQTIQLPKIHTTAVSDAGTKLVEATEKMTIIDTVEYENLIPGEKYVMNGKLMDQSTGEALLDDNENEINASTAFTAAEANGTVDVTFEFPGVNTKNITTVAFESLTYQGVEIAAHADIHDANQTVCIPEIHTTAASKAGTHIVEATKDITVVDTVVYANLIAGKEYTVRGTLMNKATGEAMLDDSGKEITAETTFVAETPNGSVDVTFVFSSVTLAGKTI